MTGIVQGVGFRPFVHRLASRLGLAGEVSNFTGGVHVEVEGPAEDLRTFSEGLRAEAPPAAVVEGVVHEEIPLTGESGFVITRSEVGKGAVLVSPDIAICPDCRRELADPADRRFDHAFINCTNCGPRFTIIRRLPYDRPCTSMARFPMCPECEREYEDLADRRYHAQPVCCPRCGPTLWLADAAGERLAEGAAGLRAARRLLAEGGIVAVKGLGGFHLACDATSEAAVAELRRRKNRWEKPLAVMAPSLEAAESFAEIDAETGKLLSSPAAPIVLVPKRLPEALAPSVAPDSSDYGVLLPYTPLHMLLLSGPQSGAEGGDGDAHGPGGAPEDAFLALVMTSGNLSEEPLCTANDEALARLGGIADAFLLHNRDILVGCDDSVVRWAAEGPIVMRRSRGWAPRAVALPVDSPPALGVGGHMKNTFCLARGRLAYPSQHIGDLDRAETLDYFDRTRARLEELLEITPEVVACDLHPDYLSTRAAEALAREKGLALVRVQHHHAHLAACLADNGAAGPALGLICDGTGYGADGTVWGCEVLAGDLAGYRRLGHLRYVGLPGGERAVEEPWRVAVAWLADTYGLDPTAWPDPAAALAEAAGRERAAAVLKMLARGLNCPYASSAGRLFDAVAALVGLRLVAGYEAQAAMLLEAEAARWPGEAPAYDSAVEVEPEAGGGGEGEEGGHGGDALVLDPRPTIAAICDDLASGASAAEVAARFHSTFVEMLVRAAVWAAEATGLEDVALSGGTFQNRLVLTAAMAALREAGLRPLRHRNLSPNDSSLCVGQVASAAARLAPGLASAGVTGEAEDARGRRR